MPTTTTVTESGVLSAPQEARAQGMSALDYLQQRGFVQDVAGEEGLSAAFAAGPVTAYVGFDPTASSLHVGHLLGIMMMASIQRFGHRPIALGGGGTALIGDPSGKSDARAILAEETIRANLEPILKQFGRYLDFAGGRFGDNPPALLVNNADWLLPLRYIPFLGDVGRYFSVNEMLDAETYRRRLETTGLNFVEFNYRLLQAYDFLHLFRQHGCVVQMGGSDQWGNIVAGIDLIRKSDCGEAFGLVSPLITTANGQKMGKSEGNSVWLDPALTSPYDFYQYWINVDDADVGRLLRLYTFLPERRIVELTAVAGAALREAKRVLAYEVSALAHGVEAAEAAVAAASALFGGAPPTADEPVPTVRIPLAAAGAGLTVASLFVRAGLCASKGDARRQAAQGGLYIDDQRVVDADRPYLPVGQSALLRRGKKRFRRVLLA